MSSRPTPDRLLAAEAVTLGYDDAVVSRDLDVGVAAGEFTVIVGPNACGKSTLLRALARLLEPRSGRVLLDGRDIASSPTRDVARRLGLLPQSSVAPDGITVADLVSRGRHPFQRLWQQWSAADEEAVHDAMAATGITDLSTRLVDELSGGQRQRVWVALVLAQQTELILLDEPTTFLDIAHQIDLLDLLAGLHRSGRTVVAVLHDLNHASRYASRLVVMRDGAIVAEGPPREVIDADLVERVFDLRCRVIDDPESHTPLVIPCVSGERG